MGFAEFGLSSYVCPICGHYSITNDRFPVCDFCKNDNLIILHGEELDKVNNTIEEMSDEEMKRWNDEGIAFHEYLRQKYVFNNPLFDKEKYNQRVDWSLERAKAQDAQTAENARRAAEEASRPRCPKCGCTEFQMVPRKWSPLTGFLTNKVDRVCVKCKTRY